MYFSFKDSVKTGGWIIILLSVVGTLAIVLGLFSSHDMMFQSVAVLLSVMVTSIVTSALLERQTIGEEKREQNLKIYENKIAVYSQFITKMWGVLSDNQPVTAEQMMSLRKEIFNRLIFYADEKVIDEIKKSIEKLSQLNSDDEANKKNNVSYRREFASITVILRNDIVNPSKNNYYKETVGKLWSAFGSSNNEVPGEIAVFPEIPVSTPAKSIGEDVNIKTEQWIEGCVHFCIFENGDYQKRLWHDIAKTDNLYPLFLCEYGESWRTNFIKERIKYDNIVFLFQKGGNGYVGMFRAKGYVIFEKDEKTRDISCDIHYYNSDESRRIKSDDSMFNDMVEAYQASELQDEENATYYSYLLTEPIVLYKDLNSGVGSISTYRRTISTYYQQYAWQTVARFLHSVNSGVANITVNTDLFDQLVKENHVVAAEKDKDGQWI